MKLLVGNGSVSGRISTSVGENGIILFRFGPGSGGDLLLRQFFEETPEGTYPVFISTHQTEKEMADDFSGMDLDNPPELVSLLPFRERILSDIEKKDRFISEGIMVTDLLEISSISNERMIDNRPDLKMLSVVTSTSSRQVLHFRMVIDSLVDLGGKKEEIVERLRLLRRRILEKGGLVLVGCPLGWEGLKEYESTLFDAVIEVSAVRKGNEWHRTFTIMNVKGSGQPPEEWEILSSVKDIPTALSVD